MHCLSLHVSNAWKPFWVLGSFLSKCCSILAAHFLTLLAQRRCNNISFKTTQKAFYRRLCRIAEKCFSRLNNYLTRLSLTVYFRIKIAFHWSRDPCCRSLKDVDVIKLPQFFTFDIFHKSYQNDDKILCKLNERFSIFQCSNLIFTALWLYLMFWAEDVISIFTDWFLGFVLFSFAVFIV